MDEKLDPELCSSILEFVLRASKNQTLIKKLIEALPPLCPAPRLKKTLLLNSISTEMMAGIVSEKILDHLEAIEGIDRNLNLPISDSMKEAYSAVAVACTVVYLAGTCNHLDKYLSAVRRIWEGRVENLEKSKSGLVSERLRSYRLQVEAAIKDDKVAEGLMMTNTLSSAIIAVKLYGREALELLGPTVLERQWSEVQAEESVSPEN